MANVFISHAGADTGLAEQVCRWLVEDGHRPFLDRDRDDGILPGEDWEERLYRELRKADAVVCVVTPAYVRSVWCAAEIGAARGLGSELLPVRFSADGVRHTLLTPIHDVDATQDPQGARQRLRVKLSIIDGTGGRGWADDQSPYPGLRPFERGEHRVFFGRKVEIEQIVEQLRSPAKRSGPEVLAIVGPSGCGKSSLVRAGVLPRIASEALFLPLAPIVPGSDPIGGLEREIAALVKNRHFDVEVPSLRGSGPQRLKDLANDILLAAGANSRCKLVVFIDQFEELLTQTPAADRANFVEALAPTLGGPILALATLRPEFLEQVATDPHAAKLAPRVLLVHPLGTTALRSVIEGPADVAGYTIDEDLVNRLVTDTGTGEALPLLAFTLERLGVGVKRGQELSLQRYLDLGGVERALTLQADAALQDACTQAEVSRDRVLSALLGLVQVDEQGRPTRRRVAFDNSIRGLFEPFVARRLLSVEADGAFVSVAHEAFLVNWKPLKDEIDRRQTALRARRVVENEAADWAAGGREAGLLLQGGKLTKATVDTGAKLQPLRDNVGSQTSGSKRRFGLPGLGSRQRRLATRVELNETGREFLEASIRSDRTRRRRRITLVTGVIVVLAIAAVSAGVGFIQANHAKRQAEATARQATASRLVAEAADMFAQNRSDIPAFQKLLAANALAPGTATGGLFDAVIRRLTTAKIINTGTLATMALSPDGHHLASAHPDGTVRMWNADTGQPLSPPVTGHTQFIESVAFRPDGHRLASASHDHTVRLWNADTGQPLGPPLTGHTEDVNNVAFSPDGHRFASGSSDRTVRLWNADTGQRLGTPLTGHTDTVSEVAFSPDGHRLASASYDRTVRVWNADTGQPLGAPLTGHTGSVYGVAFSPDGHRLASASYDRTVRVWNADTGQPLGAPLTGHTDSVNQVAFSPDGHRLASAGADHTVRLWNAETGQPLGAPLTGHTGSVNQVAFSPDGHRLVSGSPDGTVRIWDIDAEQPLASATGDDPYLNGVAFSPDGHHLATAGRDGAVRLWNADSGQPLGAPLTGHTGAVLDVAFSPDGHRLASAGADHTVRLWDADTGQPLGAPLAGHTDIVYRVAFSPDGHRLASASWDKTVRLWNADTGRAFLRALVGHTDKVYGVAFSPDGHRLASASRDGTVQLWDADAGRPLESIVTGHLDGVLDVAFSPDGHRLASAGGTDGTLRLWEADTGQPLGAPLTGHTDIVYSVAFSPDGQRLASASHDHTVRLWNADTGQPLGPPLTWHTDAVRHVAFSPGGQRLASASGDGTVRIWPATATPEMLCDKLTTNMSHKQWQDWISTDPNIGYRQLCRGLPIPSD